MPELPGPRGEELAELGGLKKRAGLRQDFLVPSDNSCGLSDRLGAACVPLFSSLALIGSTQ
jgi:hypothetical protein